MSENKAPRNIFYLRGKEWQDSPGGNKHDCKTSRVTFKYMSQSQYTHVDAAPFKVITLEIIYLF